jgi:adhesin/invasin
VAVVRDQYGNPVPGVTVTFAAPGSGASATLAGSPAVTDACGQVCVTATANITPGSYGVTATVAGLAPATFALENLYVVGTLYNPNQPVNSGATLPIAIRITDGVGQNLGNAGLTVTADSVLGPDGNPVSLQSSGNSQSGNRFRYDPLTGSYQFNLKTTGYAPGQYTLRFHIGNDPTLYCVTFLVR